MPRAVALHAPRRVVATEPGEWRVREDMRGWQDARGVPVEPRDDTRFLCGIDEFQRWADGHPDARMEVFYRDMRHPAPTSTA